MTPARSPASSIHTSNLLTYGSLLCGVAAIPAALAQNAAACGSLLAVAVIFDTFDGRFARRVRRGQRDAATAEIGTQLDSLVDAVTFGMTPIVCAALLFGLTGWLWWCAAFVYIGSAVTRLGFYNVSHAEIGGFVGLPAPVGALFWSTMFLMEPESGLVIGLSVSLGVLMIAPLPIPRPTGAGLAAFVMWPLGLLVLHVRHLT